MDDESIPADRDEFLKLAILFQGGLLLLAVLIAWLVGRPVWSQITFSFVQLGVGIIATLPMLLFLGLTYKSQSNQFAQIRTILSDTLGEPLSACHWYDLAGLALLAGVSEEFLFRGVLEPAFQPWGTVLAIILSNLIFGTCHAVTPAYAIYAALLGAYLSLTRWVTDEPNLMVPIICHSLYDFIAFFIIKNSYRRSDKQSLPIADTTTSANNNPNDPLHPVNH
ncbi:CPBP family intramembrane glutamic endopeptidase [Schlesneria paludicola]|uniref:CPBP family intramembrane glutamic endopeptidase n=1 Tax=Schlesneria paludicola TaxID=360056 RepID=UPI00029A5CB1|nr:CPBP family intramembrane glutamic endopeptidase [Schlesneria paludicola]